MAFFAVHAERTFVNVVMTIDAFLDADFIFEVYVALIAFGLQMFARELEARTAVVIKLDGFKARRRMAAYTFVAEFAFVKIIVAAFAEGWGAFVFAFLVAALTFGLRMFTHE